MRFVFLFLLLPFLSPHLLAQRPDSVLHEGQWRYIYPIAEELMPGPATLRKTDLLVEEFELWRTWKIANDPRANLKGKALHSTLAAELEAQKILTPERYELGRKSLRKPLKKSSASRKKTSKIRMMGRKMSYDFIIDPVLYDLPDGLYIQYFEQAYTFQKTHKAKALPKQVACLFELKNNIVHGTYVRVDENGKALVKGRFNEGSREGNWLLTKGAALIFMGGNGFVDYFETEREYIVADFRNNLLHGNYCLFRQSGDTIECGQFRDGRATGSWRVKGTSRFDDHYGVPRTKNLYVDINFLPDTNVVTVKNYWLLELWWSVGIRKVEDPDFPFRLAHLSPPISGDEYHPAKNQYSFSVFGWATDDAHGSGLTDRRGLDTLAMSVFFSSIKDLSATWKSTGERAWSYVYDSISQCYLGGRYDENGELVDTMGVDASTGQVFRKLFNEEGKVFRERQWDADGNMVETFYKTTGEIDRTDRYAFNGYMLFDPNMLSGDQLNMEMKIIDGIMAMRLRSSSTATFWRSMSSPGKMPEGCTEIVWEPRKLRKVSAKFLDPADKTTHEYFYDKKERIIMERRSPQVDSVQFRKDSLTICSLVIDEVMIEETLKNYAETDYTEVVSSRVLIDNKPFSGPITIRCNDERSAIVNHGFEGLEMKINRVRYKRWMHITYPDRRKYRPADNKANRLYWTIDKLVGPAAIWNITTVKGQLENGLPSGTWHFYRNKEEIYTLDYKNGLASGTSVVIEIADRSSRKERKSLKKSPYLEGDIVTRKTVYKSSTRTLVDGKSHGKTIRYNAIGKETGNYLYANGELNGAQRERSRNGEILAEYAAGKRSGLFTYAELSYVLMDDGKFLTIADTIFKGTFSKDSLDGPIALKFQDGHFLEATYKNGELHGVVSLKKNGQDVLKIEVKDGRKEGVFDYHNGVLSGCYRFYRDDTTKVRLKQCDEVVLKGQVQGDYYLYKPSEYWMPKFNDFRSDTSYFSKFYPNGKVSRQGQLCQVTYYTFVKRGEWEYSDYDGRRLYSIDFRDTIVTVGNRNDVKAIGVYTEFGMEKDGDETVVRKEFVLSEREQYNCSQEEYYAIREYLPCADSPQLKNGLTKHYFDNGMLMSEGMLENGIPVGVWKFYTPDGKLHMVGKYVEGLKEGRWLTGDLSDKAYIGEICLDPDAADIAFKIAELERNHKIRVAVYKNGLDLGTQSYSIEK